MTTIAERNQRPHWVYEIRGKGGKPLYVGCSGHLVNRFYDHERKPWWPDVTDVLTTEYPTRDLAMAAERALIEKLQPPHNYQFTEQGRLRTRAWIEARDVLRAPYLESAQVSA